MNKLTALSAAIISLFASSASPAHAYTLVDNETLELKVSAWAQAGYFLLSPPGGQLDHAPYIGMGRLSADVRYKGWGRAFVQIEGASGDLVLLDAMAELKPIDELAVRVGRFKAPTSANFLIAAPRTPFVNRPILVEQGLVPKRLLGAEVVGRLHSDELTASLQLGWFVPEAAARARLPGGDGDLISARALLELSGGLSFHLAFLELVLADNGPLAAPLGGRPVTNNGQLDAAVFYVADGWSAYLEGVVVLDGPSDLAPWSAYGAVLRNIELPGTSLSLEPGVRYEIARTNGVVQHRVTGGLTFYMIAEYLNVSANYELLLTSGLAGHALYARLQVGL